MLTCVPRWGNYLTCPAGCHTWQGVIPATGMCLSPVATRFSSSAPGPDTFHVSGPGWAHRRTGADRTRGVVRFASPSGRARAVFFSPLQPHLSFSAAVRWTDGFAIELGNVQLVSPLSAAEADGSEPLTQARLQRCAVSWPFHRFFIYFGTGTFRTANSSSQWSSSVFAKWASKATESARNRDAQVH